MYFLFKNFLCMKKLFLFVAMFLCAATWAMAQRTITGVISDEKKGETLVGATILAKGTTVGAVTDIDGKFSISVPEGTTTLVVSYVGYEAQEIAVGASNIVDVTLSEATALQEVIITALGATRQTKSLGYAAQQVGGDKLTEANTMSVVDALSGKLAGVQITSSAGTAGASSRIVLRGQTSLDGNNQALFVVDGLRIDNSEFGTETSTAGVAQSNRAIDINPADIESVTVLKGAAASALYGVDGARGVVMITTKKGNKKGKGFSVEYNLSATTSEINKLVPLQTKYGLGDLNKTSPFSSGLSTSWGPKLDTMFYDGVATPFDANGTLVGKSNPLAKTSSPAKVYNPFDVFQKGMTTQHNISLTGGDSEKTSFRLSLSNTAEEGIVPKNTYNRTNITLGTTSNMADNKLHLRSTIQYVKSDSRRITQGNSVSGLMLGLLRTPPTFDNANGSSDAVNDKNAYYLPDGRQRTYRNGVGYDNPYWTINNTPYTDQVNRFLGNVDLTYDVMKGLSINAKVGTDVYQDNRIQKYEINSRAVPGGRVIDDRYTSRNLDAYLTALGTLPLTQDLTMNYTVGGNMYASYLDNLTVQGDGLDNTNFANFNNTKSKLVTPSARNQKSLSLLGSVDFGYKNFLYVGLTGRNDWVSNLIVPSKEFNAADISFFYPSANLSFVFSELAKINWMDYGKIRVSGGQVGGGAPNPYLTSTPYNVPIVADGWSSGVSFPFKNLYGLSVKAADGRTTKGSIDLKPSKTTDLEVGFETKLFRNRVSLDVSVYQRASSDQIISVPVSSTTGFSYKVSNSGSLRTKGIDVVLGLTPIRMDNGFRWDMNFNFTKWNTIVESLADGVKTQFIGGFASLMGVYNIAGQPYGQLYGGAFMRTNDASGTKFDPALPYNPSGKLVIIDKVGDPNYGRPATHPGNVNVGNPNADFLLGITNSFTFKGFSVSGLIDIRQGGQMWNGTLGALQNFGMAATTENRDTEKTFEGVKASDGTPNNISTKLNQGWYTGLGSGFGAIASQFIEDASFVRLRQLNASYKFDPKWLKIAKMSDLTIGLTGRNLWLQTKYTGVDPETSLTGSRNSQGLDYFNMPNTKSWALSLGVKF
jgi:TonB-linked SusC/RagA family outer membrane protein